MYKSKKKKKTPLEQMVFGLVKDRLCFLSQKYIELGGIPRNDLEAFITIGEAYLASNGNSEVKKLYNQAKELPIIVK